MVGFRRQVFRNIQCRTGIGGRRRQPLQARATVGRGSSWLLFDAVAFVAGPSHGRGLASVIWGTYSCFVGRSKLKMGFLEEPHSIWYLQDEVALTQPMIAYSRRHSKTPSLTAVPNFLLLPISMGEYICITCIEWMSNSGGVDSSSSNGQEQDSASNT